MLLTITILKVDLTKNIGRILNDLQDEVTYAVEKNIGNLTGMGNFIPIRKAMALEFPLSWQR